MEGQIRHELYVKHACDNTTTSFAHAEIYTKRDSYASCFKVLRKDSSFIFSSAGDVVFDRHKTAKIECWTFMHESLSAICLKSTSRLVIRDLYLRLNAFEIFGAVNFTTADRLQ